MATSSSFLCFLLSISLVLFLSGCLKKMEANDSKELSMDLHQYSHLITVSSLMPARACSTLQKGSKILNGPLQVTHRYGPCSPLEKGKTTTPSLDQTLLNDQTRVQHIHSKTSNQAKDSAVNLPAKSGQSLGTGNFVVRIGIGTPKQKFTVALDTGSDLTWIQCKPCVAQCYSQKDPIFNPFVSSTYSNISSSSNACKQLQSFLGDIPNPGSTCTYKIVYGDGSFSAGYFVHDKLTLAHSNVFPKFKFGCGEENQGMFGSVDGLLGLGRNRVSVVSQTALNYGQIFSYCLPSRSSFTGYLAFGNETGTSSRIHYTPLVKDVRGPSFYFLNMTGISVGRRKLRISSSVFTTGTIIDSGTVITRLPPKAYSALRSAFRNAMSKYPLAPAFSMLDTCYNLVEHSTVMIPSVVLHFEGGTNLNVDKSGILVQANSTQHCLAFAGNSYAKNVAILGNMQQKTFEVVYNVAGAKLGFGAKGCS